MKKLIKRILQEQSEEWIDISPEDYYDLLKYVNGNGSLIKKIPQYKGKKINFGLDLETGKKMFYKIENEIILPIYLNNVI